MEAIHNARAVQLSVLYWVCVGVALAALTAYVSAWLAVLAFVVIVGYRLKRGKRVLGIQWIGRCDASLSDGIQHPKYPWLKHSASALVLLDKDAAKAIRPKASKG